MALASLWAQHPPQIAIHNMKQIKGKLIEEEFVRFFKETPHLGKCAAHFKVPLIEAYRCAHKLGLKSQSRGGKKVPLDEILKGEHPYYQTGKLKRQLLQANVFPYECDKCAISDWNGLPLSLHLDHINGDSSDHRLGNLRFLCPNCHSQTETYCGKNKGKCPSG